MRETDPLVKALLRERYGCNDWWTRRPPEPPPEDDDVTTARRRRELVAEAEADAARDAETA